MLKIGVLTFCLVVICINLALGQHSKASNIFHLMRMVLWMLFMFVGNVYLPDLDVVAHDVRMQVGIMLVWLGISFGIAWACVRAFRHGVRI